MSKRKVAVITGTRAEYGLLYWIIKGIHEDSNLELQLFVTGMHLSPTFGMTVDVIEKDGFPIAARVPILEESDTEDAIAVSMGKGMIAFADIYKRLRPDIILILGDRFELLAAVAASLPFCIPVAHISGGESSEGLIDEPIRHAITKMSHLHFTSTEKYRKRVIQMGENPERVFCVGSPALDNVYKLALLDRNTLLRELNIETDKPLGVVTFHPVTLERNTAEMQIVELLKALECTLDIFWVITMPNADTEGRVIIREIKKFGNEHRDKIRVFISLGQVRYLSLLKHAVIMVGNSSSGIVESPAFELPVINIGDRQRGRIRTKNILDVQRCERKPIADAIQRAISIEFKRSLQGLENPYGNGTASEQILEILRYACLGEELIKKRFYDTLL